jgi:hypothetical protein
VGELAFAAGGGAPPSDDCARDSGSNMPRPIVVTEPINKLWINGSRRRMRGLVPRSHAVARTRQRATRPSVRAARVLAAVAAGYVCITACAYSDYPIEATFCDDWCRVLRRTGCEQEPENCIRDCEGSLSSPRCRDHQAALLACYESTPADRFACVGQGFQSTVRPQPEICTEQRHALIGCEAPRVLACIEACSALDTSSAVSAFADAGARSMGERCPEPPFPCERLCWELDARGGGGGDFATLGEPAIRCALARANECRAAELSDPTPVEPADTGEPLSWTRLFLECAGLPADLDIFE